MHTYFTCTTQSLSTWLVALAGSLVFWGVAYAYAQASRVPEAILTSYHATSPLPSRHLKLKQLLLGDADNALALRQLGGDTYSREQRIDQNYPYSRR